MLEGGAVSYPSLEPSQAAQIQDVFTSEAVAAIAALAATPQAGYRVHCGPMFTHDEVNTEHAADVGPTSNDGSVVTMEATAVPATAAITAAAADGAPANQTAIPAFFEPSDANLQEDSSVEDELTASSTSIGTPPPLMRGCGFELTPEQIIAAELEFQGKLEAASKMAVDTPAFCKQWPGQKAEGQPSREIETHFHVLTNKKRGLVTQKMVEEQISVLNRAYAGAGFKFRLGGRHVHEVTYAEFTAKKESSAEAAIKARFHRGESHTLNVYTWLLPSILGWSTSPGDFTSKPAMDGVVSGHACTQAVGCTEVQAIRLARQGAQKTER
jgi:hypothetical protein